MEENQLLQTNILSWCKQVNSNLGDYQSNGLFPLKRYDLVFF